MEANQCFKLEMMIVKIRIVQRERKGWLRGWRIESTGLNEQLDMGVREKHQFKVQSLRSCVASNAINQKRGMQAEEQVGGCQFGCSEFELPVEIAGSNDV